MKMNRIHAAAAVLAFAAAPLSAQETVHLRFGWQPGMSAQVEYEQVRMRVIEGRRDSMRIASTYRMDVSEHAEGLSVVYSGTRWTEVPAADPTLGRFYEALARTASGGRARTVVRRSGEFLRVEGVEAVSGEVDAAVQPLLTDVDASMQQNVRGMVSSFVTPQALTAAAADEWNALIYAWSDEELEVGEPYEMESSFQFPLFPGVRIPLHLELKVAGRTPCTPDEREARCVLLELSSTPDKEMLEQALRDLMERSGAPEDEVRAYSAQFNVQTHIRLHSEPETLRPHLLRITRTISAGEDDEAQQVETRTFRYRYAP